MNKDEAHRILLRAVVEHVGLYKGGPTYFTALDNWIRTEGHLMDFMDALIDVPLKDVNLIVSGAFGRALVNLCSEMGVSFKRLVIVNGDLRRPNSQIDDLSYLDEMEGEKFMYLDDSYYSGKTLRHVDFALRNVGAELTVALFIYDGSVVTPSGVLYDSLFRYYDWEGR